MHTSEFPSAPQGHGYRAESAALAVNATAPDLNCGSVYLHILTAIREGPSREDVTPLRGAPDGYPHEAGHVRRALPYDDIPFSANDSPEHRRGFTGNRLPRASAAEE